MLKDFIDEMYLPLGVSILSVVDDDVWMHIEELAHFPTLPSFLFRGVLVERAVEAISQ